MLPDKKSIIRVTAAIVAAAFVFTQCGINTAFALRTPEPKEQAAATGDITAELTGKNTAGPMPGFEKSDPVNATGDIDQIRTLAVQHGWNPDKVTAVRLGSDSTKYFLEALMYNPDQQISALAYRQKASGADRIILVLDTGQTEIMADGSNRHRQFNIITAEKVNAVTAGIGELVGMPAAATGFQKGTKEYRDNEYALVTNMSLKINISHRRRIAALILGAAANFENVSIDDLIKFTRQNFSWWSAFGFGGLFYNRIPKLISGFGEKAPKEDASLVAHFQTAVSSYIAKKGGTPKITVTRSITPDVSEFETTTNTPTPIITTRVVDVADVDAAANLILKDTDISRLQEQGLITASSLPIVISPNSYARATQTITLQNPNSANEKITCEIIFFTPTFQPRPFQTITKLEIGVKSSNGFVFSRMATDKNGITEITSLALDAIEKTDLWQRWIAGLDVIPEELAVPVGANAGGAITAGAMGNELESIVIETLKNPDANTFKDPNLETLRRMRYIGIIPSKNASGIITQIILSIANPNSPTEVLNFILSKNDQNNEYNLKVSHNAREISSETVSNIDGLSEKMKEALSGQKATIRKWIEHFEAEQKITNANSAGLLGEPVQNLKRLLIVEDTEAIRNLLEILFKNSQPDITVITASSYLEFEEKWQTAGPFDAILTDTGLSDTKHSGVDVVKRINPDNQLNQTPVAIWTTTYPDFSPQLREQFEQLLAAGKITGYFIKPVQLISDETLKNIIRQLDAAVGARNAQASATGIQVKEGNPILITGAEFKDPLFLESINGLAPGKATQILIKDGDSIRIPEVLKSNEKLSAIYENKTYSLRISDGAAILTELPKITVIGSLVVDIIVDTSKHPKPTSSQLVCEGDKNFATPDTSVTNSYLDTLPTEQRAALAPTIGGPAFATARVLHELGVPVKLIACVGQDELGDMVIKEMQRIGLDTSGITRAPKGISTSTNLIFSDPVTGKTAYNLAKGGANEYLTHDAVKDDDLKSPVVHLGGIALTPEIIKNMSGIIERAHGNNALVGLDTVIDPYENQSNQDILTTMRQLDYITPSANINEGFLMAQADNPTAVQNYFSSYLSIPAVFTKIGENGSLVKTSLNGPFGQNATFSMPIVQGVDFKDGTGTGDSFAAFAALGIALGLSPEETAKGATVCGALTAARRGGGSLLRNDDTRTPLEAFREEKLRFEKQLAQTSAAAAGTLVKNTDYEDMGNGIRLLRTIGIGALEILPNGVTIDPSKRGEITGAKVIIGKGTQLLKNATLEGEIVIGQNTIVGGYLGGTKEKPMIVGQGAEISGLNSDTRKTIVGPEVEIKRAANISETTIVSMNQSKARVGTGTIITNSVVAGGNVGQGVYLRKYAIIGPNVTLGFNSEGKAILFFGASKEAGIEYPHQGYMGSVWAIPIIIDAQPFTEEYYKELQQKLQTIMFGNIISDEPVGETPISSSGALRKIILNLDGSEITIMAQRDNFGAGTTTSDYDPKTGLKLGSSVAARVSMGINARMKAAAFLDNGVLVGNVSEAGGYMVPGTLLGGAVAMFEKPGYLDNQNFTLGDGLSEQIKVELDYFRRLQITAEVLAEGARRAVDPFTLAGYQAALNAVKEQFNELGSRFGKIWGRALDLSLQNLSRQGESVNQRIIHLKASQENITPDSDAGKEIKKLEERLDRLNKRIQEQEQVSANRKQYQNQLDVINQSINNTNDGIAETINTVYIADIVRRQTLDPSYIWQNPLQATAAALGTPGTFRLKVFTAKDLETYLNEMTREDMLPGLFAEGEYGKAVRYDRIAQLRLALSLLIRINDIDAATERFLDKAEQVENGRHAQYVAAVREMAKTIVAFAKSFAASQFINTKSENNPQEGSILSVGLTAETGLGILAGRVRRLPVILFTRTNEGRNLLLAQITYNKKSGIPATRIITLEENGYNLNKAMLAAVQRLKKFYPKINTARYYFAEETEQSLQDMGLADQTISETTLKERGFSQQEIDFMKDILFDILGQMGATGLVDITEKDKDAYDAAEALALSL